MSFNGSGEGERPSDEECEDGERFPVLSVVYSLLAALIIGHLLVRWHLRRRKLSRFRSSQPGDKSFKSKRMRTILKRDFSAILSLTCDPRLSHSNFPPQIFGSCADGEEVPSHWHRMAAFDAAADFVAAHTSQSSAPSSHENYTHPRQATPLSDYLSMLSLRPDHTHFSLIQSLTDLYTLARYGDGEFGKDKLQLFLEQLQQLREILSSGEELTSVKRPPADLPLDLHGNPAGVWQRQSTTTYSSQDPLLRLSSMEVTSPDDPHSHSHLHSRHRLTTEMPKVSDTEKAWSSHQQTSSVKSSRQRAGHLKMKVGGASDSELSPLVTTQMSPASLPKSPTVFEEAQPFISRSSTDEKDEPSSSLSWQLLPSVETQV